MENIGWSALLAAVILLRPPANALAQENSNDLQHQSLATDSLGVPVFEPFPILSYDTDVGLGYGAKVVLRNCFRHDESFDLIFFNSTKGERWYRFVFSMPDMELRQGKIYPLALDITIDYDKWIKSSFFGIGNGASFDNREYYTKEPLEISLTLSRAFSETFVGQAGARFKAVRNYNFSDDSRLAHLLPSFNRERVAWVSIFASVRYDTRNSFINPFRGLVLQSEAELAPVSGSDYLHFSRFAAWVHYYAPVFNSKVVIALRGGVQGIAGDDLPVQVLMSLGGSNNLRGSSQDRYLDRIAALFNAEARFPLIWRFGGVLALDGGRVWHSLPEVDFARWVVNPTVGLRFYMETFVVRLDVGFGKEATGFYLNFGHIF